MTDLDLELISRYISGRCSRLERSRFEQWLAESPDHLTLLEAILAVKADGDEPASAAWRERVGEALRRHMASHREPSEAPALQVVRGGAKREFHLHRRSSRWLVLVRGAAALAAVVAAGTGVRALLSPHTPTAEQSVALRTITTPRAQRAVFRLPDSSRVVLGVASTLRHAANFHVSREVILEGEAYFEVTHDEQRPFVVRAGELIAEDLGTEFVVRAYPGEPNARVVVREGKVELRGARDSTAARVVQPGELGRLAAQGGPVVEPADTAAYFSWTEGVLVFTRAPLREALPQLGRWYDLEFKLADSSLASIPLSGSFEVALTDDALDALAAAVGLRKVRRDRVVTLYPVSRSP